jgi:predicted TIM-barrel fold metal-dependent hydrolase
VPWITVNGTGELALETLREHGPKGVRGIKFHPAVIRVAINDRGLEPFYGLAERWRLPVLYHTGPHGWELAKYLPLLVDQVAQRHPNLPLIVEHLGGRAFAHETFAVMQNNKNVMGGLATCLTEDAGWHVPAEQIKAMLARFGATRFCFGSDFPYNTAAQVKKSVAVLRSFKLAAADLALILSGNLERLVADVKVAGE